MDAAKSKKGAGGRKGGGPRKKSVTLDQEVACWGGDGGDGWWRGDVVMVCRRGGWWSRDGDDAWRRVGW
ncbi:hypothetical protein Tco_0678887 [Tanacetum coccineum]|uniref:Uncharacterized protein n=1 Tax=Tanacetum coccineum TaxID=301880 RepID=A0ABQ4XHA2_9ASTR